jgi:hypothetical protein
MSAPTSKLHWLQARGLFPNLAASPGIELMSALAQQTMREWNKAFPIGTPVWCFRTYGDERTAYHSVTTSEAWIQDGHSALIWVEGQEQPLALTHVTPLLGRAEVPGQRNLQTLKSCVTMVLQDLAGAHGEEVAA